MDLRWGLAGTDKSRAVAKTGIRTVKVMEAVLETSTAGIDCTRRFNILQHIIMYFN